MSAETENIKYKLVFSRRRSISIIVRPDKSITVRAPLRTPLEDINRFVRSKSGWIKKHTDGDKRIRLTYNDKEFTDGEIFLFLGKEYRLQRTHSEESRVWLNENEILTGQTDPENPDITRHLISGWYAMKAREILPERLAEIIRKHSHAGFRPAGLTVRSMKSRWGSCSTGGRISLNSELVKLSPEIIDYVIIHELCHLKHHNHGPGFYDLLSELLPGYKLLRKKLREYHIC